MTVSGTTIGLVSNYTVGAAGDMTEETLTLYAALTAVELNARAPGGLTDDFKDMLHALLIVDMFECKDPGNLYTSERIGDYSYTRASPGKTAFRARFEALIKDVGRGTAPSAGVTRADHTTAEGERAGVSMKLDQNPIGGFD